jgi:ABC-type antimicrobial peptide transport system permease subunit
VYQPATERSFPFMAFVVRTAGDPLGAAASIRRAAAELDPSMPLAKLRTMDEHLEVSLARPKFFSTLVTVFGALAVTLALVGIYAMMAWSVGERRQEFAIRLALGARNATLVRMVLAKALALAGAGIAAGLACAWAAAGVVSGLLYGMRATEPAAFASTAVLIAAVALAACYVPARRAMRADPLTLLR